MASSAGAPNARAVQPTTGSAGRRRGPAGPGWARGREKPTPPLSRPSAPPPIDRPLRPRGLPKPPADPGGGARDGGPPAPGVRTRPRAYPYSRRFGPCGESPHALRDPPDALHARRHRESPPGPPPRRSREHRAACGTWPAADSAPRGSMLTEMDDVTTTPPFYMFCFKILSCPLKQRCAPGRRAVPEVPAHSRLRRRRRRRLWPTRQIYPSRRRPLLSAACPKPCSTPVPPPAAPRRRPQPRLVELQLGSPQGAGAAARPPPLPLHARDVPL